MSNHTSPQEAIVSFCKANIGRQVKFGAFSGYTGTIYSFYFFTEAVYPKNHKNSRYGLMLKQFIEKNELGTVIESPVLVNKAFHKDHSNCVYLWMPDQAGLNRWWKAYQDVQQVNQSVDPSVVASVQQSDPGDECPF